MRAAPESVEVAMDVKSLVPWRSRGEMTKPEGTARVPSILGLHRQVDRLFDDFFRDFESPMLPGFATDWPALEVQDNDKETKIVAELPGLDEKDIDLSLREGVLTIKGEKTHKSDGAVYSERWRGQFTRTINVGQDVDPDKVRASFDKGVLTVTLEKRPNAKTETKKIAINRN
jgi:HSP20 family protein